MRTLAWVLIMLLPALATAKPWWLQGSNAKADDFLEPDAAFKPSTRIDGDHIHVAWRIADGYYLYRSRFHIEADSPGLAIDPPAFPRGTIKTDPYLGTQEIYTGIVETTIAYHRRDAGAHPLQIRVTYQGCAEAGLCYPEPAAADSAASRLPTASLSTAGVAAKKLAVAHGPAPRLAGFFSWTGLAIIGGMLGFLIAGFVLRHGRRLDFPE
jgi:thiol:disulfide interchange protein DsbD